MGEALYRKQGRRYVPALDIEPWSHDRMAPGTFRLVHCYQAGAHRYVYDVTPDTAAWHAAAMQAKAAMVDAMQDQATAFPEPPFREYTPKQRELIEKFRADMAAAGGLMPAWWTHSTAEQIADAGIAAVAQQEKATHG